MTLASVKLLRNGQSPIIPVDSTLFIGDFKSGGMVTCRYKISVSQDATNQTYPVDLSVSYTNREGAVVTSSLTTVGVPVNAKPAFTILSPVPEVPRGAGSTIEVQYRNDGTVTVYDAQARLSLHAPVTIGDTTAYFGDIAPVTRQQPITIYRQMKPQNPWCIPLTAPYGTVMLWETARSRSTIPVQISVVHR